MRSAENNLQQQCADRSDAGARTVSAHPSWRRGSISKPAASSTVTSWDARGRCRHRRCMRSVASRFARPSVTDASRGGSASTTQRVGVHNSFSGPAQAYCALRPNGLLTRPSRALSRGFGAPVTGAVPLAGFDVDQHLHRWGLSPHRVFAPVRHTEKSGLGATPITNIIRDGSERMPSFGHLDRVEFRGVVGYVGDPDAPEDDIPLATRMATRSPAIYGSGITKDCRGTRLLGAL